ncbi:hypothetical protein D7003_04435 [Arthrobacter oryzae]|uniref:Uncharacterized protein n=1 Tax=Arthrobacter oryzae TaxID=409290 RepID=A0A3N0C5D8_9MICC|nr:hypothetical protein D7003_04435 [Arthrobacter oryzae]
MPPAPGRAWPSSAVAAPAESPSQTTPVIPASNNRRNGLRRDAQNVLEAGSMRTPPFPDDPTIPFRLGRASAASPEHGERELDP